MLIQLKRWARRLKQDVLAIWIAARDSRTPWHAKLLALFVAGYAISPVDLIPDFIPVIGYLDDIIIVPLGIWCVVRLIPTALMEEYRAKAAESEKRPVSHIAAGICIAIWVVLSLLGLQLLFSAFSSQE